MNIKRKFHTPQGYIAGGMIFFLIAILATQIADGRLVGALITNLIGDEALTRTIQGFADGFALPMLFASIFFSLRGYTLQRNHK